MTAVPDVVSADEKKRGFVLDRSLPLRLLTAVIAIPILAFVMTVGGIPFFCLVALLIVLGLWEFFGMMSVQGLRPYRWLGLATGIVVAWFVYSGLPTHANLFVTAFLLGTMAVEMLRPRDHGVEPMAVTLFGVFYVGWLAGHLLYLREMPFSVGTAYGQGVSYVMLAVLPTWACDTSAYGIGMVFGRNRIHPNVSPKKSVEGSVAGLVGAMVVTVVAYLTFASFLELWQAILLGFLIGVFAQVGDLVESVLKRTSRAKDSASYIPGHGGVLDRFDSLFFTAPLTYYFLMLAVFGGSSR